MGVEALQRKLEVPLSEAGAHTGKSNIISASFLCSPSLGNVPSMRRGTYSYLISVYRMNGWMGGTMSPISSGAPPLGCLARAEPEVTGSLSPQS